MIVSARGVLLGFPNRAKPRRAKAAGRRRRLECWRNQLRPAKEHHHDSEAANASPGHYLLWGAIREEVRLTVGPANPDQRARVSAGERLGAALPTESRSLAVWHGQVCVALVQAISTRSSPA